MMSTKTLSLNAEQAAMLAGEQGPARQMGMRLVLDMAAAAGATALQPIAAAHLSGVSPLTGGLGLRRFLARLGEDPQAQMAVPTTLNSAGCDSEQFAAMRIVAPDFKAHHEEIVARYAKLGVRTIQSCIPYEWEGGVTPGTAAWSESNAICFGNSYCDMVTNRESGLSALAAALTGYTPVYGLLHPEARQPNLEVIVDCSLSDPTDFSILGDWIGKQRAPHWRLPLGPIPLIRGLAADLTHEQRKALTAAAANYGCPLLYLEGEGEIPAPAFQDTLTFTAGQLAQRYEALRPGAPISLIVIGCPQASIGELQAVAKLLADKRVTAAPETIAGRPPLWIFTSAANKRIAQEIGVAQLIEAAGALLLQNTCPEVVPYDQGWVAQILTNSMKAEHYIQSGLNGIPTAVMPLADCIAVATGEKAVSFTQQTPPLAATGKRLAKAPTTIETAGRLAGPEPYTAVGHGLPSQSDFSITGPAFVTGTPITLLGFVNRQTGVIEEAGHPADGQSLAGKIAIFPKGSGSTVAPYVLLELFYRGQAPLAIVNSDIDQQTAPACSLEGIPYAYNFDSDVIAHIRTGDLVQLSRRNHEITLRRL